MTKNSRFFHFYPGVLALRTAQYQRHCKDFVVKMVHADASNFAEDVSKEEAYEQVLLQAEGLFTGQRNWVCNLANAASLLWHAYKSMPAPSNQVNWAGFYVLDKSWDLTKTNRDGSPRKPQLILGPFQGKVACQTISFGKGVCGTAAQTNETQLVRNVEDFPGHIACDGDSQSEIVVPIIARPDGETEQVVAIIDIDCATVDGFDEVDKKNLEELAALIGKACDW